MQDQGEGKHNKALLTKQLIAWAAGQRIDQVSTDLARTHSLALALLSHAGHTFTTIIASTTMCAVPIVLLFKLDRFNVTFHSLTALSQCAWAFLTASIIA